MDEENVEANYIAGTPYVGMTAKMYAAPQEGGYRGEFLAWDIVNRRPAWQIKEDLPVWSGALVTAGDVAFYGTMDGWFKAVDARTGKLLLQFKCGSGIIGQPTTYKGPDGKQYVSVLAGVGGWAGAIVAGGLDARDSSAALGFVNAVRDLPDVTTKGGTLYVFALPCSHRLGRPRAAASPPCPGGRRGCLSHSTRRRSGPTSSLRRSVQPA